MWLSEEGIAIATSRTMRKLGIAEERNVTPINIDWNISSGEDGGEFTAWARDGAINFIAGKTYSVTTDSGSFTTVCKNHDGILYLGNLSFIIPGIPNAGESFVVMETADAGGVASGAYDFNKGKTLTIAEVTETTTPIDPKYLPGVCLPVVELTTVGTSSGAALTAEESAKMDEAAALKLPCIIKNPIFTGVYMFTDSGGIISFGAFMGTTAFNVINMGGWKAMMVES